MIYGSETELLVVQRREENSPHQTLRKATVEQLSKLLWAADQMFGRPKPERHALERVQMLSGAVLYIDGDSLEFATPPCEAPVEVALYERDFLVVLESIKEIYEEQFDDAVEFLLPGAGEAGASYGYHENYGLDHKSYFKLFTPNFRPRPVWMKALVPFLVARVPLTGSGGLTEDGFIISRRAHATTHVFHQSSYPQRPIVHLKRPDLNHEILRVQVTCSDAAQMAASTINKFAFLGLALMGASHGAYDDLNLTLADPVQSMKDISRDIKSALRLADGGTIYADEILQTLLGPLKAISGTNLGAMTPDEYADVHSRWTSRKRLAK